jgi:hypothetical protein
MPGSGALFILRSAAPHCDAGTALKSKFKGRKQEHDQHLAEPQ